MHPYRVKVRICRRSGSLFTRPEDQKTLTCQSSNRNDAPSETLLVPVTWNPVWTRPYSTLWMRLRLRPYAYPLPSQSHQALHRCVKRLPIVASGIQWYCRHWHPQLRASSRFRMDSTQLFFDLIRLNCGFGLIRLNCFFCSIRLTSNVFIFDLIHKILITYQSGFRESHIGQSVSEIFQHWNFWIFHNSDNLN